MHIPLVVMVTTLYPMNCTRYNTLVYLHNMINTFVKECSNYLLLTTRPVIVMLLKQSVDSSSQVTTSLNQSCGIDILSPHNCSPVLSLSHTHTHNNNNTYLSGWPGD